MLALVSGASLSKQWPIEELVLTSTLFPIHIKDLISSISKPIQNFGDDNMLFSIPSELNRTNLMTSKTQFSQKHVNPHSFIVDGRIPQNNDSFDLPQVPSCASSIGVS